MSRNDTGLRQVLVNAVALFLAYVVPRVFTMASVVFAARWLGADGFGAYGTAAAFAVILAVVATLGMLPLLVRELSRAPERGAHMLRAAHVVKTVSSVVMLAAAAFLVRVLFPGHAEVRNTALVLVLGWAANAYAENLAAWYQAAERMGRWTQASALFGVVSAVLGVALLVTFRSVTAYACGFVAGWSAALVWLHRGLPPEARRGSVTRADLHRLLIGVAPFAGAFVGLTIYSKMDVLLLQRWSGATQVGLYSAAYKFVDIAQALLIVAAGSVFPRLSRTSRAGGAGGPGTRSTEVILLVAVPAGLLLHLVAAPTMRLLFGPAYEDAGGVLAYLALVLPFLALNIHGGYVLGAAGRMRPVAALYGVGVALNLGLNAVLIPVRGAEGAAMARVASESLLAVGVWLALRHAAGVSPGTRTTSALLGVAVAGWGAVAIPDPSGGWLRAGGLVLMAALLYVGMGVVTRDDVSNVRNAFGRVDPVSGPPEVA